jgi:galactokinase
VPPVQARPGSCDVFVVRAPGRVNVIGDHTDYQDGLCLPIAIDREVVVRARERRDGMVVARSDAIDGVVELPADGRTEPASAEPRWGRSIAAVLQGLAERGRAPVGFDADVSSTLPVGSGLSSSAAFTVAVAIAAAEIGGLALDGRALARAAQAAEQQATGVPCGVMDQMASVFGRAGHALLLDCRNLDIEAIPLPASVGVAVVHTGVARRLEDSTYAERRAACAAAAASLGVATLRDATIDQVADDPLARHVVSENQRVLAFVDALRAGDPDRCGRLMDASHASLRDDFRVSTPELDALVDSLVDAGAYGARLTGAGFGGCVVGLVAAGGVDDVVERAGARYRSTTGLTPMPLVVRAVDGAGLVT